MITSTLLDLQIAPARGNTGNGISPQRAMIYLRIALGQIPCGEYLLSLVFEFLECSTLAVKLFEICRGVLWVIIHRDRTYHHQLTTIASTFPDRQPDARKGSVFSTTRRPQVWQKELRKFGENSSDIGASSRSWNGDTECYVSEVAAQGLVFTSVSSWSREVVLFNVTIGTKQVLASDLSLVGVRNRISWC